MDYSLMFFLLLNRIYSQQGPQQSWVWEVESVQHIQPAWRFLGMKDNKNLYSSGKQELVHRNSESKQKDAD